MTFKSTRPKLILKKNEAELLQKTVRSRKIPHSRVERAKFLLSYFEGMTISSIARENKTNRPKIENTIDKALAYGVDVALNDLPRKGRPRRISDGARAWIISIACMKSKDLGYASELWTQRALRDYVQAKCDINNFPELRKISEGTIIKILNKSNIKPHKIKDYIEVRDPEFETKSYTVLCTYKKVQILRNLSIDNEDQLEAYISYDEKPGIQAIENMAPDLPPIPGKFDSWSRDNEYIRHGTLSLLAGIDLVNGQIYAKVFDRHRSREFIEFLKYIDTQYPTGVTINVILDNHSAHISKETKKFLLTKPNRFHFVFTPKHASWLNIIESFFSKMTRTLLRGIRVSSKSELKMRILLYIDEVNEVPIIFKWTYKMDELPGGMTGVSG